MIGVTYVFGVTGFAQYDRVHNNPFAWTNAFYNALLLFFLKCPHLDPPINLPLEFARWSGVGVGFWVALAFAGKLLRRDVFGWWHRRRKGRVILCASGEQGIALLHSLLDQSKSVAVLDELPEGELTDEAELKNCPIIYGKPNLQETWQQAGIQTAGRLVIAGQTDGTTAEILDCALKAARDARLKPLSFPCDVQLGDMDLRLAIEKTWSKPAELPLLVGFSDPFAISARKLLLEIMPLDGTGISEHDPRQVHLVILGFGRMGRAVAVEAAYLGQFANQKVLRISVLDRDARRHEQAMRFRYRNFNRAASIYFYEQEACSEATWKLLEEICQEPGMLVSIAICFDHELLAVEIALRLRSLARQTNTPMAVRLRTNHGLAKVLEAAAVEKTPTPPVQTPSPSESSVSKSALPPSTPGGAKPKDPPIHAFGALEETCNFALYPDPFRDDMARNFHKEHVANAQGAGRDPTKEELLREWEKMPEMHKNSSRRHVDHLSIKLRALHRKIAHTTNPATETIFTPQEIPFLSEWEHRRWCAERWLDGWTPGPKPKNEELRTHPDLKPWSELEPVVKDYDTKIIEATAGVLRDLGKQIEAGDPTT